MKSEEQSQQQRETHPFRAVTRSAWDLTKPSNPWVKGIVTLPSWFQQHFDGLRNRQEFLFFSASTSHFHLFRYFWGAILPRLSVPDLCGRSALPSLFMRLLAPGTKPTMSSVVFLPQIFESHRGPGFPQILCTTIVTRTSHSSMSPCRNSKRVGTFPSFRTNLKGMGKLVRVVESFMMMRWRDTHRERLSRRCNLQMSKRSTSKGKRIRELESGHFSQIKKEKNLSQQRSLHELFEKKADRGFQGECSSDKFVWSTGCVALQKLGGNSDIAPYETSRQLESQRMELSQANQSSWEGQTEKSCLFGELVMKNTDFQEDHAKYCQETEELPRVWCAETELDIWKIDELSM